jgi:branched-chain amino acid transport system permease protein
VIGLLIDTFTLAAIFVVVGLGYVLVYSVLGIFHLVHGDVVIAGGLVALGVLNVVGVPASSAVGAVAVLVLATAAAVAVCTLTSIGIEAGVYRRLRSRSILTPLLAALGLSLILENILLLATSKDPVAFPQAVTPQGYIEIGEARLSYVSITLIIVAVLLLAGTALFIKRSRLGAAMLAVAQDREAAELVGLPTKRITATAFALAGGLAGVAGVMYGMYVGSLKWSMGLTLGIKGFAAALIGGLGSIIGAGVGALVLAAGEIFGVGVELFDLQLDSGWREAVAYTLVILVLLVRPSGLLSRGQRTWQVRN